MNRHHSAIQTVGYAILLGNVILDFILGLNIFPRFIEFFSIPNNGGIVIVAVMSAIILGIVLLLILKFILIYNLHNNYSQVSPILLMFIGIFLVMSFNVLYLIPGIWASIYNDRNKNNRITN
ncbi:hypothetical protein [Companilactobacillus mishanensis]|uniref:hypothetical protein n=1 Tax=Companilactobacillus mishanensis TaxID=2486008 RepID=UPI00129567FC|nr:hypothetical protein [Companilactobacillus mishanensis]MQS89905.1 hypothetical protein [Companilactobacillus mishanensis]